MSEQPVERAFLAADDSPALARCALLFLDLLGVREMTRGPKEEVERHLVGLHDAITRTYRDYLSPQSPWPAAFFSDTLVLAAPVEQEDDAAAVGGLVLQAAQLQVNLYRAGFFARGGITLGLVHMREGLLFGPALVEAYELESRHAVHPRVILSREAARAVVDQADHRPLLLADDDGWTFADYLGLHFEDVDDVAPAFDRHRAVVTERLRESRGERRVWEKYRWVAEYHNDVARRDRLTEAVLVDPEEMTWRFTRLEGAPSA